MGLDPKQFYSNVIVPTLDCMGKIIDKRMASEASKKLVLGTFCAESNLKYIREFNDGPGLGLGQMKPSTYDDIVWYCENVKGKDFYNKVIYCIYEKMYVEMPPSRRLIFDLRLQTVFTRLHYWRVPEPIPEAPPAQAQYWKAHYNSELGKGTVAHYLNCYPAI